MLVTYVDAATRQVKSIPIHRVRRVEEATVKENSILITNDNERFYVAATFADLSLQVLTALKEMYEAFGRGQEQAKAENETPATGE